MARLTTGSKCQGFSRAGALERTRGVLPSHMTTSVVLGIEGQDSTTGGLSHVTFLPVRARFDGSESSRPMRTTVRSTPLPTPVLVVDGSLDHQVKRSGFLPRRGSGAHARCAALAHDYRCRGKCRGPGFNFGRVITCDFSPSSC